MAEKGLLFIPDISGFTKFINENEIEHSRIILEELLENIISSNKIGLHVSEVEGDAILFYRFGENASFKEISSQVEQMFCNFQKQLKNYESNRMCLCAACKSAVNLSLKIITHYGEFSLYTVRDFNKLIGKDVIIAHQLLKNDITLHEYWLATNNLIAAEMQSGSLPQWIECIHGIKETEHGNIDFDYSMLTLLKENLKPDPLPDRTIGENKIKVVSVTKIIDKDLVTLISTMGNLSLRPQWQDKVVKVDGINHPIYHLGVKFRLATAKGTTMYYASSFINTDDFFSLSETDEHKTHSLYITLKSAGNKTTSVTFDMYLPDRFINHFIFPLLYKKKMEKSFIKSLSNLEVLLKKQQDIAEAM